jgi:hypothetical protein
MWTGWEEQQTPTPQSPQHLAASCRVQEESDRAHGAPWSRHLLTTVQQSAGAPYNPRYVYCPPPYNPRYVYCPPRFPMTHILALPPNGRDRSRGHSSAPGLVLWVPSSPPYELRCCRRLLSMRRVCGYHIRQHRREHVDADLAWLKGAGRYCVWNRPITVTYCMPSPAGRKRPGMSTLDAVPHSCGD